MEQRLVIHCVGGFATPPQKCAANVAVSLPVGLDTLSVELDSVGWYLTIASQHGKAPMLFTTLCPECGAALLAPAVVSEAKRLRSKGKN
jgi:hypothetical protein